VLEVAFPNGKTRKAWIEANVIKVEGHRVKESLDSLARKGITDIATHLIDSGRCAVAHAGVSQSSIRTSRTTCVACRRNYRS
jgi:hypothetical protein